MIIRWHPMAQISHMLLMVVLVLVEVEVLVLAVAVAVSRHHAHRLSLRAVDFEAQLGRMRAAGELPPAADRSQVPREIKRDHVTLTTKVGEGQFGACSGVPAAAS